MQYSLAIKPSEDDKRCINAVMDLLHKTLPSDWKKVRLYIENNNNVAIWKGTYSLKDTDEITFTLNKDLINNLEMLRDVQNDINPLSGLTFYSDHRYEVYYQRPKVAHLTLHEIEKKIKELQALDLEKVEIDSLKKRIQAFTVGYQKFLPPIPSGQKFYRGVPWPQKPENVYQLSYPPTSAVTKLHRAGRSERPLFYCSAGREAVFYELGLYAGGRLAISEWETTDVLRVNNVGFNSDSLQKLGSDRPEPSWKNTPSISHDIDMKANDLIEEFFANQFTKAVDKGQEHLYKISIAIAEQHLQGIFDGLLYPAMAMKGNADNLAIKPSSVDEKLVLKKVEYYQITDCCKDGVRC